MANTQRRAHTATQGRTGHEGSLKERWIARRVSIVPTTPAQLTFNAERSIPSNKQSKQLVAVVVAALEISNTMGTLHNLGDIMMLIPVEINERYIPGSAKSRELHRI